MEKKKIKSVVSLIFRVFFVTSLIIAIQFVGFFTMYFSITLPEFQIYQNDIYYQISCIFMAFGFCFAQVIIIYKYLILYLKKDGV